MIPARIHARAVGQDYVFHVTLDRLLARLGPKVAVRKLFTDDTRPISAYADEAQWRDWALEGNDQWNHLDAATQVIVLNKAQVTVDREALADWLLNNAWSELAASRVALHALRYIHARGRKGRTRARLALNDLPVQRHIISTAIKFTVVDRVQDERLRAMLTMILAVWDECQSQPQQTGTGGTTWAKDIGTAIPWCVAAGEGRPWIPTRKAFAYREANVPPKEAARMEFDTESPPSLEALALIAALAPPRSTATAR